MRRNLDFLTGAILLNGDVYCRYFWCIVICLLFKILRFYYIYMIFFMSNGGSVYGVEFLEGVLVCIVEIGRRGGVGSC